MQRCSYAAARHTALPCVLAFIMAAAFLSCPRPLQAAGAGVSGGATAFVFKLALDPQSCLELTSTLSYKADLLSVSLKSSTEGMHEFRLDAKLAEKTSSLKCSATLGVSGLLKAPDDVSRWRQLSSNVGVVFDKKVNPWQPEGKMSVTVREYPLNCRRDYAEGTALAKARRVYDVPFRLTVKGEAGAGHKEMPYNPKWTANFWNISGTAQLPLGSTAKAAFTALAKGREYPGAEHKSYSRASCKLTGMWAPSKVHSLNCDVATSYTVRMNERSKDKVEGSLSAKWSVAPSPYWGVDLKASLGSSEAPNQPTAGTSVRAIGGFALTCTPVKRVKLTAAGDLSLGHSITDDGGDDEGGGDEDRGGYEGGQDDQGAQDCHADNVEAETEPSKTAKFGLGLTAKIGPFNGAILDGRIRWKREDQQVNKVWQAGEWVPSAEIQVSMRF